MSTPRGPLTDEHKCLTGACGHEYETTCMATLSKHLDSMAAERDALRAKLAKAVQYLKEGKARFSPHTTNSFVDDFIAENERALAAINASGETKTHAEEK